MAPGQHGALRTLEIVYENERGFQRRAIRTDYRFDSVAEAARILGFFFGEPMVERVEAAGSERVPECTGLRSLRLPGAARG